jgi:hypothetical protein
MRARHIFTAIAIVFFSLPIALRIVGVQAHEFENHALAPAPKLSQGWDLFPQTTRFFTDRMPLREQAVTADRNISKTIFDTDPAYGVRAPVQDGVVGGVGGAGAANIVTIGRDGWLFTTESLANSCKQNRPITVQQADKSWGALRSSLVRPGKRVLIVVVPDKDTIYPEKLPDSFPQKDCLPQDRDALWDAIEHAGDGFVPMRTVMEKAKRENRGPVYLQQDSHWNGIGATYLPRTVLPVLGNKVRWDPRALRVSPARQIGDLEATLYFKKSKVMHVPYVSVHRAASAPRIPGDTVLIGDSFTTPLGVTMPGYFQHYTRLVWDSVETVGSAASTDATARRLARADTVIMEVGERHYLQMAKPTSAKPAGPTGLVAANINYLTQAIRAEKR